jgi:4-hydroxyphenylpyruvate dioxygenase
VGRDEAVFPAVVAPDGSLLYFCERRGETPAAFESDFAPVAHADVASMQGARVDHVVQALPQGQLEPWLLFERAVLGLVAQRSVVLNDPYGAMRSRELESSDQRIRASLVASERERTAVARSVARYGGAGVQQIAIAVGDVVSVVLDLRAKGAPFLQVPANYYDDLAARYALEPAFVERLREAGVLYERGERGEFLHAYAVPFEDRFEFEFVERRGGYALYGSTNAPVRLAALAEWRAVRDAGRSEAASRRS